MGPDYICCSGLHIVQGMDPADTLLAQFNHQQYTEVQEYFIGVEFCCSTRL